MNVCLINSVFEDDLASGHDLLARYWHIPHLAAALTRQGCHVTVVQAFHRDEQFQEQGVSYRFIVGGRPAFLSAMEACQPAIVHVFGLKHWEPLAIAGFAHRKRAYRRTASFHGGSPPRRFFRRYRLRRALSRLDAVAFSAPEHAEPWQAQRMFHRQTALHVMPELASPFSGRPLDAARAELGVDGKLIIAWSGRLVDLKQPFVVLEAMERVVSERPGAMLYMAYSNDDLLSDIQSYLAARPVLANQVVLLGQLPHASMEMLFSAADLFVQASEREHGGNSLTEAMSCGAIPVVSDIPSFRVLTESIDAARRFPVGDANALAEAILAIDPAEISRYRTDVQMQYRQHLGYDALARHYMQMFSAS